MLTLYDELFLLSLHEEKCSGLSSVEDVLGLGISAAILSELALAGKLTMDEKTRLFLADAAPTQDAVLDEAIERIGRSDRPRKPSYWIEAFAEKPKKKRDYLVERLVNEGILLMEDKRPAWVVPSPFHPEINASTKYAVKHHLRTCILTRQEATQKVIALLSTMSGGHMLELIFLKDELKIARNRIRELLVGEALNDMHFQVIEEIQSSLESLCEGD